MYDIDRVLEVWGVLSVCTVFGTRAPVISFLGGRGWTGSPIVLDVLECLVILSHFWSLDAKLDEIGCLFWPWPYDDVPKKAQQIRVEFILPGRGQYRSLVFGWNGGSDTSFTTTFKIDRFGGWCHHSPPHRLRPEKVSSHNHWHIPQNKWNEPLLGINTTPAATGHLWMIKKIKVLQSLSTSQISRRPTSALHTSHRTAWYLVGSSWCRLREERHYKHQWNESGLDTCHETRQIKQNTY